MPLSKQPNQYFVWKWKSSEAIAQQMIQLKKTAWSLAIQEGSVLYDKNNTKSKYIETIVMGMLQNQSQASVCCC